MITEGKMQYLYDDKGRRYLDVSPGLRNAGVSEQSHVPNHSALYNLQCFDAPRETPDYCAVLSYVCDAQTSQTNAGRRGGEVTLQADMQMANL